MFLRTGLRNYHPVAFWIQLFFHAVTGITRILDIALTNNNDVVILGAFGCGAFENNPGVVAAAAKNVVYKYIHAFRVIEFAVYCSPRDSHNYDVFNSVLGNIKQRHKR